MAPESEVKVMRGRYTVNTRGVGVGVGVRVVIGVRVGGVVGGGRIGGVVGSCCWSCQVTRGAAVKSIVIVSGCCATNTLCCGNRGC